LSERVRQHITPIGPAIVEADGSMAIIPHKDDTPAEPEECDEGGEG